MGRPRIYEHPTRVCERCNAAFVAKPYEVKRGRARFCSHACAASQSSVGQDLSGSKNPNWRGGISDPRKQRYCVAHPEKHAAHQAVKKAIRAGTLVRRPCEVCGESRTHGHHDDYSQPLSVRWLCVRHHEEAHHG